MEVSESRRWRNVIDPSEQHNIQPAGMNLELALLVKPKDSSNIHFYSNLRFDRSHISNITPEVRIHNKIPHHDFIQVH